MAQTIKEFAREQMEKRLAKSNSAISPYITNAQEVASDGTVYYVDYKPIKWEKIKKAGKKPMKITYTEAGKTKVLNNVRSISYITQDVCIATTYDNQDTLLSINSIDLIEETERVLNENL